MRIGSIVALAGVLFAASSARAQPTRIPLTPSQNPTNANVEFSQAVWAGDTLYVSGWLDGDRKTHTDAKSQTVAILEDIKTFLVAQHLTMGDVVMIREFIENDPTTDAKANLFGARAAYPLFFGNKDEPNKPASTAVEVVLPSADSGALVEIDLIAVRPSRAGG